MSEEKNQPTYEWAESVFRNVPDVEPKNRDMLAMLAATMMGNPDAAKHFYNRALVDGASDAELERMVNIARGPNAEIANLLQQMSDQSSGASDSSNTTGTENDNSTSDREKSP